MACRVIFLILPAVTYCVIKINIKVSKSEPGAKIEYTGSHTKVIEENERQLFHIGDKQLKKVITNISHHKPDDVFVRGPTPWNDLYETYDWDQVETIFFVKQVKLLRRSDERVNVSIQAIINNSSSNITFKAEMTGIVADSVVSKWNISKKNSEGEEISYNIGFVGGEEDDNINFAFTSPWGVKNNKLQSLIVGSGYDATTIELESGSALVTTLTAMRSTLDLQIDYKAHLVGDVAYNYAKMYKGHHFWRTPISKLLFDSGLPNEFNFKEIITTRFYYDAIFVVRDTRTETTLLTLPIALHQNNFYT